MPIYERGRAAAPLLAATPAETNPVPTGTPSEKEGRTSCRQTETERERERERERRAFRHAHSVNCSAVPSLQEPTLVGVGRGEEGKRRRGKEGWEGTSWTAGGSARSSPSPPPPPLPSEQRGGISRAGAASATAAAVVVVDFAVENRLLSSLTSTSGKQYNGSERERERERSDCINVTDDGVGGSHKCGADSASAPGQVYGRLTTNEVVVMVAKPTCDRERERVTAPEGSANSRERESD